MKRWEYCEVWWQPQGVSIVFFRERGGETHKFPAEQWASLFARLGLDGWELVNTMASPTGVHEYWYYFKRPVEG